MPHRTLSGRFSIPRYRRYGSGFRETCVVIHKGIATWGWASNLNRIPYRPNPWPTLRTFPSLFQDSNRVSKFAKIYRSYDLPRIISYPDLPPREKKRNLLLTGQWLYGKENCRLWDTIDYLFVQSWKT